jgi:hypothetical protein
MFKTKMKGKLHHTKNVTIHLKEVTLNDFADAFNEKEMCNKRTESHWDYFELFFWNFFKEMLHHYFSDTLCISESTVMIYKTDLEILMDLHVLQKWTLVYHFHVLFFSSHGLPLCGQCVLSMNGCVGLCMLHCLSDNKTVVDLDCFCTIKTCYEFWGVHGT